MASESSAARQEQSDKPYSRISQVKDILERRIGGGQATVADALKLRKYKQNLRQFIENLTAKIPEDKTVQPDNSIFIAVDGGCLVITPYELPASTETDDLLFGVALIEQGITGNLKDNSPPRRRTTRDIPYEGEASSGFILDPAVTNKDIVERDLDCLELLNGMLSDPAAIFIGDGDRVKAYIPKRFRPVE